MSYTPYYPTKWASGETGGTPITPEALNNMEDGISAALRRDGGTMTGILQLTEGIHYGDTLPTAGTPGRIFFKVVKE